jgi:apolipoprotein N-acyltransferase
LDDASRRGAEYKKGNQLPPAFLDEQAEAKSEDLMNPKYQRFVWLAVAALLGFFIGGKWNIPLAAWIAPVFAIRFFRESEKAGRNFLLLWLASAIPTIVSWNGVTFFSKIHPAAEAMFFFVLTPLALLPYVIDRAYCRRFGSTFWLTLVYPIAATAMDFFSANGSPLGTFGAAAYSQRGFLPLMQVASITGLWGITFLLSWFASLVNYIWDHGFKLTRPALASAGLFVLILALGLGRTLAAAQPEQTAQIAGFSLPDGKLSEVIGQLQSGNEAGFRQMAEELHAQQLEQIRTLARQGAQIVTLQEGAGLGQPDQVQKLLVDATVVAREAEIYIVLPTFTFGSEKPENAVHVIDPGGKVVLKHVKFGGTQFEGSQTGSGELQAVDTPYGRLSAVICWDADFPNVIRQAGAQDVDLLFVPSNDWLEVRDIHAGMATFRAVENGLSIYRQTGSGVSSVIDAYGRTLQRVDVLEEEITGAVTSVQMVNTPVGSVSTLYPFIGDIVGNAMLVLSLGLVVGLWLSRKRVPVQARAGSVTT